MTKCDLVNGPCACGAWHYPNDGTFGQPGMWSNRLPNGGDPARNSAGAHRNQRAYDPFRKTAA